MSRSLHDLDQSLAKESSLRSTLLATLLSLNGAIKQCNAGEIVVERDRVREHLESLESHRTSRDTAILAVAKEFGEDTRPVTLKSIEPRLPGGWGNRFASHRSNLGNPLGRKQRVGFAVSAAAFCCGAGYISLAVRVLRG